MKIVLFAAPILGFLLTLPSTPTAIADDWPQWRGPSRDGKSSETGLLQSWPANGPAQLWMSDQLGLGYSGPAVARDRIYILGTAQDQEKLFALQAGDGKVLWAVPLGLMLKNGWGDGPRSTPTLDGDRVYAMSGRGYLICVNSRDGDVLWKVAMRDLGGSTPNWGYTESVLVDDGKVICTPGGDKGTLAALDKTTGDLVWQSDEFTDPAHYASAMPATFGGVKQYVQLTEKHLGAVRADSGEVSWLVDWPGRVAVIPTPVVYQDKVYVTSGYDVGCMLVQVQGQADAKKVYDNKIMKNHHGGVIRLGDHIYGHSDGEGWTCQDFHTGEQIWSSKELGKGAVSYADNRLYCQEEDSGTIVLVNPSPNGWEEHGRFQLSPQSELRNPKGRVWTHPVIANGKLYLRDQELFFCYDIAAN